MSGYQLPSTTDWVTCDWQCHRDRDSGMPGTDYGAAYGEPLYAVEDGTVTVVHTATSGANGRYAGCLLDDGRETWALHLSAISVSVGQRVTRGQRIGSTGASGYGSDWYYGPHVHQALWPARAWDDPTIDFERYVGDPPADDEEDGMGFYFRADPAKPYGYWNESTGKARKISKDEWDWRTAVSKTAGGVPIVLVDVSSSWYDKAFAL